MCLGSREWNEACNEVEFYCKGVYEKLLESGFRHLEDVRVYSSWDKVVATNVSRFVRIR